MSSVNPYQAPTAAVADVGDEVQAVRIFSVAGRIGRARYIAYTLGLTLLVSMLGGLLIGVLAAVISPDLAGAVTAVMWLAILVLSIMLTIQRCHDFNTTGWLAILAVVPLVNLMFWIIPGTDGKNRFGPRTPPNGVLTLIAAWVVPFFVIVGIAAAVAIPAYQDAMKRAQSQKR